jgi:poly-gamma-glutamate synthesis protein (capsule biosynthesis protein)
VIASIHTGIELCGLPEPYFRVLARRLIDAGAALVVGHHPHVPQGVERYGRGLIAYSLGNFLFDRNSDESWLSETQRVMRKTPAVLNVTFDQGGVTDYEVQWFARNAAGAYEPAAGDRLEAVEREFDTLCAALRDPAVYRRQMQSVFKAQLKGLYYYTPAHFLRRVRREGPRQLVPFLWWLSLFWKQPVRWRLGYGFFCNGVWLCLRKLGLGAS